MSKKPEVFVSAQCLSDARSRVGGNFATGIATILDDGYPVAIDTGSGQKEFADSEEFLSWFHPTKQKAE